MPFAIEPPDDIPPGDSIAASCNLTMSAAATLGARAALGGAASLALAPAGTLDAVNGRTGAVSLSLAVSGHLQGVPAGRFSLVPLVLDAQGTLSATASLAASSTLSLATPATATAGAAVLFALDGLVLAPAGASSGTLSFAYPHSLLGLAGFRAWREGVDFGLIAAGTTPTIVSPAALVSGLVSGQRYTFLVAAESLTGERGPMSSASITFASMVTAPAPTGVSATAGVRLATVSWVVLGGLAAGQRIAGY